MITSAIQSYASLALIEERLELLVEKTSSTWPSWIQRLMDEIRSVGGPGRGGALNPSNIERRRSSVRVVNSVRVHRREHRGTVPLLSHMAEHLHGALPDPAHRGADVQVTTVPVRTQPAQVVRLKGSKAHEQPCDELVRSTMMNASRLIHKGTQCKEFTGAGGSCANCY